MHPAAQLVLMLWNQPLRACSRRYEDNFDAVTNLTVITQKTDKSSISGYGSPEKFLNEFKYLLGTQVFTGELPVSPIERPAAACSAAVLGVQLLSMLDTGHHSALTPPSMWRTRFALYMLQELCLVPAAAASFTQLRQARADAGLGSALWLHACCGSPQARHSQRAASSPARFRPRRCWMCR